MAQQRLCLFFPYSLYFEQAGGKGAFGMLFVMIGNGEAVDLLLYAGHERESRAVGIYLYLPAAVGDCARAVLTVLNHTENRHGKAHIADDGQHGVYLRLTAVKKDEIGQDLKSAAFIVVFIMLKAAAQHLVH